MLHDLNERTSTFYPQFEYYCFKNCYLQILEYYGIYNAKYFIDCTTDWAFRKDSNKGIFTFDTGDPYSSFLPPFDQLVNKVTLDQKPAEQIWEENIKSIREGIPVVIAVDIFYLTYTPFYHKKHSYHSLILSGYEDEQFYVIDWYPPWYFKGMISKRELDEARSSANEGDGVLSGTPIDYLYTTVSRDGFTATRRELLKKEIQLNLDLYYNGVATSELAKGHLAISKMIDLVEESFQMEEKEQKLFFETLYQQLFFTPTRKNLFHWYLETVGSDYKSYAFEVAVYAADKSIKTWKGLLSLLIKCSMSSSKKNLDLLIKQCMDILENEKQFYYALYELNRSIT
ncbi:MAG: BtrH N-terminal domain-containing protein [Clostridiales bacterium]|nr:BtrH N-terminal domain-containing protein [Clostridiales bacterium]